MDVAHAAIARHVFFFVPEHLYADSMRLETICIFCASAMGQRDEYRMDAEVLGSTLAARGVAIVYGGATVGLMGVVADAALRHGGRCIGVIPQVLVDKEITHEGLSETHLVDTMHTRKALMAEKSDAFLILPGGYGTLEEMFEVLTWQTLRLHAKPTVILNTAGFYDHLLRFLDHCVQEGILKPQARANLLVATTVDGALRALDDALAEA